MIAYQDIFEAAKTLGITDRSKLVDDLIDTLHKEDILPLSPAWQQELQRRNELLEQGKMKLYTWQEVKQEARSKVGFNE